MKMLKLFIGELSNEAVKTTDPIDKLPKCNET